MGWVKKQGPTAQKNDARKALFRKLMSELAFRAMQPLKLYRPMPQQLEFHRCQAPERLAIGSNRAAKTMTAAIEVAMAALGEHPYIDYPKGGMRIICVAKDGTQIGQVMYKKLFKSGAFWMIPDSKTGLYRVYEPWRDKKRKKLRKPSLPLIPHRFIESVAWENKAQDTPKLIKLKNGTEILFCSSMGKPPRGMDVDLVWFDEELKDGEWYSEMAARLIDRSGRFIWSATPQSATIGLFELHDRAIKERNDDPCMLREFNFSLEDNPYISEEDKLLFIQKFANDPEQYRVRVLGEFLLIHYLVYPNFKMETHGCDWFDIPRKWTRYIVVDPGYARTYALFLAVPPPDEPDHVYIYDELFITSCTSKKFGEEMRVKCMNQTFQEFLIDRCGSRKHDASGKTIAVQYAEALAEHNIQSVAGGSNFTLVGPDGWPNGDELRMGVQQVRSWLWEREGMPPKLRVMRGVVQHFIDDMTRYRNKKDDPDKPDDKKHSEGPDCLRYAVMRDLSYVEPRSRDPKRNPIQNFLKAKRQRRAKDRKTSVLLG